MQKTLGKQIFRRKVPLVKRGITAGASLMTLWILTLYAIIIGIWWNRLHAYFVDRGTTGGISHGGNRLAAVALTGHMCDVTMGLALIPVSRHSALASFFQLSVASTLTLHMLSAYTLFTLVLAHALIYVSWIRIFSGLSAQARMVIPVLNPTYLYHETWPGNKREVHPFTTITHLATQDAITKPENDELMVQFLFRKIRASSYAPEDGTPSRKPLRLFSKFTGGFSRGAEWTEKLAGPLDRRLEEQRHVYAENRKEDLQTSWDLDLRLEGPYFSPADPSRYHTVICLVAGTGISGALAIAGAFIALQKPHEPEAHRSPHVGPVWRKCIIVWSIRDSDYVELPMLGRHPALEMKVCLTGPGRPRQDMKKIVSEIREGTAALSGVWTYISGPRGFIESAKTACRSTPHVDYHAASWEI
ncbi:MAG: hypothetical protein Q9220_000692 [cf. Caloplaca sp. 1 TL-2023]